MRAWQPSVGFVKAVAIRRYPATASVAIAAALSLLGMRARRVKVADRLAVVGAKVLDEGIFFSNAIDAREQAPNPAGIARMSVLDTICAVAVGAKEGVSK